MVFQPKTCDLKGCTTVFTPATPANKYCSELHQAAGAKEKAQLAKARREAAAAQLHNPKKRKKGKSDPAEKKARKKAKRLLKVAHEKGLTSEEAQPAPVDLVGTPAKTTAMKKNKTKKKKGASKIVVVEEESPHTPQSITQLSGEGDSITQLSSERDSIQ